MVPWLVVGYASLACAALVARIPTTDQHIGSTVLAASAFARVSLAPSLVSNCPGRTEVLAVGSDKMENKTTYGCPYHTEEFCYESECRGVVDQYEQTMPWMEER